MNKAKAATTGFSKDTQTNLQQMGTKMSSIGTSMTRYVTLPILALGAAAAKSAVDWESAWAGVTKTVDGTAQQMATLEGGLRQMAKELPATHAEIAAVAEAAGALGVGVEHIEEFTRVMIDLGETTNLTADDAATAIAQIANVTGMAMEDVDRFGSTLVDLGNNGASTEREILALASRIAGTGSVIGLTESEILGFSAALADVGINAEAGGTAFSQVMQDIASAVATGGDELQAFAEIAGMTSEAFSTMFQNDPASAIAAVVEGFGRISSEGGNVFAALDSVDLTGRRVVDTMLRLSENADGFRASLARAAEAWQANNALQTEAEKRYETTGAQLEMLRNKVVDLFIDLGPMIMRPLMVVAGMIEQVVAAFQMLPGPVQGAVLAFLALVAAIGPIMKIGGAVVKNIEGLSAGFHKIGAMGAVAKTSLIGVGLAAVAMAGDAAHAAKQAEDLRKAIDEVNRAADDQLLKEFGDGIAELVSNGMSWSDAIAQMARETPGAVARLLEMEAATGAVSRSLLDGGYSAEFAAAFVADLEGALKREADAAATAAGTSKAGEEALDGLGEASGTAAGEVDGLGDAIERTLPSLEELAKKRDEALAYNRQQRGDEAFRQLVNDQIAAIEERLTRGREAAIEFDRVLGSADWGRAEFDGAAAAMTRFNDGLFGAARELAANEAAVDALADSFRNADGDIVNVTASFDLATEAGRQQQSALEGVAAAMESKFARAYDASNGSLETFIALGGGIRAEFVAMAEAAGIPTEKANELADALKLTEGDYEARFHMSGVDEARLKLELMSGAIQLLDERDQVVVALMMADDDFVGAYDFATAALMELDATTAEPGVHEQGAAESAERVEHLRGMIEVLEGKKVDVLEEGAADSDRRVEELDRQIDLLRGKIVDVIANVSGGGAVDALGRAIGRLHDKTVTVRVNTFGGGTSTTFGNYGGIQYRAEGGPVTAGQPYVVGEKRPELFVPHTDGHIVPFVPAGAQMTPFTAGGGGTSRGGDVYNLNFNAPLYGEEAIKRTVNGALRERDRRVAAGSRF